MQRQTHSSLLIIIFIAVFISQSTSTIENCYSLHSLRKCGTKTNVDECFIKRELSKETVLKLEDKLIIATENLTKCNTADWTSNEHKQRPCTIQEKDEVGNVFGVILMEYDIQCVFSSGQKKLKTSTEHVYHYQEIPYSYNNSSVASETTEGVNVTSDSIAEENIGFAEENIGFAEENIGFATKAKDITLYALGILVAILTCTNIVTCSYSRKQRKEYLAISQDIT